MIIIKKQYTIIFEKKLFVIYIYKNIKPIIYKVSI